MESSNSVPSDQIDTSQNVTLNIRPVRVNFQDPRRMPCVRESFLYAIGGGMFAGFAQYFRSRNFTRANLYGVGSFLLIASISYPICTIQYYTKREQAMEEMMAVEFEKAQLSIHKQTMMKDLIEQKKKPS